MPRDRSAALCSQDFSLMPIYLFMDSVDAEVGQDVANTVLLLSEGAACEHRWSCLKDNMAYCTVCTRDLCNQFWLDLERFRAQEKLPEAAIFSLV